MQASYGSHEIIIWEWESTIRGRLTTPGNGGEDMSYGPEIERREGWLIKGINHEPSPPPSRLE